MESGASDWGGLSGCAVQDEDVGVQLDEVGGLESGDDVVEAPVDEGEERRVADVAGRNQQRRRGDPVTVWECRKSESLVTTVAC